MVSARRTNEYGEITSQSFAYKGIRKRSRGRQRKGCEERPHARIWAVIYRKLWTCSSAIIVRLLANNGRERTYTTVDLTIGCETATVTTDGVNDVDRSLRRLHSAARVVRQKAENGRVEFGRRLTRRRTVIFGGLKHPQTTGSKWYTACRMRHCH